jgi:orotidine-5'-phosphate decarboxylase
MIALDVPSPNEARILMDTIPECGWWKIGLELFSHPDGPAFTRDLVSGDYDGRKTSIFLDLKFADIPTTVGRAVASIYRNICPAYLSVREGLAEAMTEADKAWMEIVYVPHLTSDLMATAIKTDATTIVTRSQLLDNWKALNPDVTTIVPGVRLPGQQVNDHRSPAPPNKLADYIVVGRPIRDALYPAQEYARFVAACA